MMRLGPRESIWLAENVPGLGWLADIEGPMLEYGYLFEDPDIGAFRSRLSPEELERADRERGADVGALLDALVVAVG